MLRITRPAYPGGAKERVYFPKNERQRDFDENRGKKICRKICRIDLAGEMEREQSGWRMERNNGNDKREANNEDKFKICSSILYLDGGISGSDDFNLF